MVLPFVGQLESHLLASGYWNHGMLANGLLANLLNHGLFTSSFVGL